MLNFDPNRHMHRTRSIKMEQHSMRYKSNKERDRVHAYSYRVLKLSPVMVASISNLKRL